MIRVENLRKTYDRGRHSANQVLHDLSFELPDTGFVCIVGPSGCGKTSLLNAMGGLDDFDGGNISTDQVKNLRCSNRLTEAERNRSFGYIFQNYYLLPEYSAAYNVYLGLHSLDLSHEEKLRRVMKALREVDMDRYARRAVGQLSGGQQQRVAIARALARQPRVIFADEPTGNLDEANTMNICSLLRQISRSSLVVMVTHEERIARFFADRIITLEDGRLTDDSEGWQRSGLTGSGTTLYTGEFEETVLNAEGLELRLLREDGAPPLALTLVVQKDRVVLKLDDSRTLTCGKPEEHPRLEEGTRPVLRLEDLEQERTDIPRAQPAPQGRAGSGLRWPMLLREARRLFAGKGIRKTGSLLFLAVLTVLALFAVGDYLKVASLEPEDFITTHSHVLEFQLDRGRTEDTTVLFLDLTREYPAYLEDSGLDFDYIPHVSVSAEYALTTFLQQGSESEILSGFSYVPLSRLEESDLILGRMPERSDEIVVDRWVLENLMERDGIVQNGITDISHFLDKKLIYSKKTYSPTIVGISDSGEPALYLSKAALASIGNAGNQVISLSELQKLFPGRYDDIDLDLNDCIMVTNNAGEGYANRVGATHLTNSRLALTIVGTIEEDTYASIVVSDVTLSLLLRSMTAAHFHIYCADKEAMAEYLADGMPEDLDSKLRAQVTDRHSDAWAQYSAAAQMRMDGRRIVTASILLLALVMLWLLQRSRVQERVGMVAVYRLLGIPGRKLMTIFALESLFSSLAVVLPCTVLVWAGVHLASSFPSVTLSVLLPWPWALAVFGAILCYHLLVSLLPLGRLLRLPPARLAAQYDI